MYANITYSLYANLVWGFNLKLCVLFCLLFTAFATTPSGLKYKEKKHGTLTKEVS